MNPVHASNCERLRRIVERREAVYVEKGALRVRVSNVRADLDAQYVSATVEEVPTPGLETTPIHESAPPEEPRPLRWEIGAGVLSRFSEHTWWAGYAGMWSLCWHPQHVAAIVELASKFDKDTTPMDRYGAIMSFIHDHPLNEDSVLVFPD